MTMTEKVPQILQDLTDLGAEALLELVEFSQGYEVSDLKPATVNLQHGVYTTYPETTYNSELSVSFFIERDGMYRDYSVDLYTKPGSDQLWHNQEPVAPIESDVDTVCEALKKSWWCEG